MKGPVADLLSERAEDGTTLLTRAAGRGDAETCRVLLRYSTGALDVAGAWWACDEGPRGQAVRALLKRYRVHQQVCRNGTSIY